MKTILVATAIFVFGFAGCKQGIIVPSDDISGGGDTKRFCDKYQNINSDFCKETHGKISGKILDKSLVYLVTEAMEGYEDVPIKNRANSAIMLADKIDWENGLSINMPDMSHFKKFQRVYELYYLDKQGNETKGYVLHAYYNQNGKRLSDTYSLEDSLERRNFIQDGMPSTLNISSEEFSGLTKLYEMVFFTDNATHIKDISQAKYYHIMPPIYIGHLKAI